jgi:hypothetical protein
VAVFTVLLIATGVYAVALIVFGFLNRGRRLTTGKAVAVMIATIAAGTVALFMVTSSSKDDKHARVVRLARAGARAELQYWHRNDRFTSAVRLDLATRSPELDRLLDNPAARLEVVELSGDGQRVILRAIFGTDAIEQTVEAPGDIPR